LELRNDGDRGRVNPVLAREVQITTRTLVERSNINFLPRAEMETPHGSGPTSQKEGLHDDMHFAMRRLFSKDDASPDNSDSLPNSSGNTSPNLPLVLYQNPVQFLSKIIKVIKVHKVYNTYQVGGSCVRNSSCSLGLQGSS